MDFKAQNSFRDYYAFIYYLAFGLFSVANLIDKTTIENLGPISTAAFQDVISALVLFLLVFKLLIQKYTYRSLVLLLVAALIVGASVFASGSKALMWIFLFVAASQNIEIKKIAKISVVICAAILFITIALYAAGMIEGRYLDDGSRSSLGFAHPNRLGTIVLTICVSLVIIFQPKISLGIFIGFLCAAAFIWLVSESRTAVVAVILVFIVGLIANHEVGFKARKRICIGMLLGLIVFIVGSFFFMVGYDSSNTFQEELNRAVSGRIYWAHYYFETYGISLFGHDYTDAITFYAGSEDYPSTFLVDNAYVRLLLGYGLVPAVLFLGSLVWFFVRTYKEGLLNIVACLLFVFCIVGIMESSMIDVAMNYCLILLSGLLYKEPKLSQQGSHDEG